MESKIQEIESEIAKVNRSIEETEQSIKKVEQNIEDIDTLSKKPFLSWGIHTYGHDETVALERLMNEKSQLISYRSQLMNKESQLRDEKNKLRDKESQLRDEKTRKETEDAKAGQASPQKTPKILDMNNYFSNELQIFMKQFEIHRNVSFNDNCLEYGLEERLTADLVFDKNIVFLIAVSGAGKTRRVYEELYKKNGIFFTCSKIGNGGSIDFENCIECALSSPEKANIYFKLLICARMLIVNYLLSVEKFSASELLLAQIHPEKVFKSSGHSPDIFFALFDILTNLDVSRVTNLHSYDQNLIVVVDEIQHCLRSATVFLSSDISKRRTVFSPVFKTFCLQLSTHQVIYAGTGLDYAALKEHLASYSMKDYPWKTDSNFQPMKQEQILNYSLKMLKYFKYPTDKATEIATIMSENSLLVGARPRFTANILNSLMNTTLEVALEHFNLVLLSKNDLQFPIKNWDDKKGKLIGNQSLISLMLTAIASYFARGFALVDVLTDNASELIYIGIGYSNSIEDLQGVVLSEEAIVQALFTLIPIEDIAKTFLGKIKTSLNASQAGFHFEYLVMFKYYCDFVKSDPTMPFEFRHGSLATYLKQIETLLTKDGVLLIFPDNCAGKDKDIIIDSQGPDLILTYRKEGKTTIKFIQVKFTKKLTLSNALRTTNYKNFYRSKKSNRPLTGYKRSRKSCLKFFKDIEANRSAVFERYIVYQGEQSVTAEDGDKDNSVIIISKHTCPDFFNSLGLEYNVWDNLDAIQSFVADQ